MKAAEKKIVIEKGADFNLKITVTEGIGTAKNISDHTMGMKIMKQDSNGNIVYLHPGNNTEGAEFNSIPYTFEGSVTDAVNGECNIPIDKDVTASFPLSTTGNDVFATEYSYNYIIDLVSTDIGNGEDMRLLRGRCAVRV